MDYRIEQDIKIDLEMTLALVRSAIQADCRVIGFEIHKDSSSILLEVIVGEKYGSRDWRFLTARGNEIEVHAGVMGFNLDLQRYLREDELKIEVMWEALAEELVSGFFERNPEYQKTIQS